MILISHDLDLDLDRNFVEIKITFDLRIAEDYFEIKTETKFFFTKN